MDKYSPEFIAQVEAFVSGEFEYSCGNYDEGLGQMSTAFFAMLCARDTLRYSREQWDKFAECSEILRNAHAQSWGLIED